MDTVGKSFGRSLSAGRAVSRGPNGSMKKFLYRFLWVAGLVLSTQLVNAQRVAFKSNLIDWATLSPNLALEMRLNGKLTLDVSATANPFPFTIADVKATHARLQPELRYWFNRPMARHFVGLSFLGGIYNVAWKKHFYEGDMWGAGLSYGYAFVLSRHWNVEATLGVGMARIRAFDYREGEEKPATPNLLKWSPVPIRLGLSFSYIFK